MHALRPVKLGAERGSEDSHGASEENRNHTHLTFRGKLELGYTCDGQHQYVDVQNKVP